MKKLNGLYSIESLVFDSNSFGASIRINPSHIVFKGHFPGFPVTPAVIQMYWVKSILEKVLNKTVSLVTCSRCTFLKVINPLETNVISINATYSHSLDSITVNAKGVSNSEVLFKITASYKLR